MTTQGFSFVMREMLRMGITVHMDLPCRVSDPRFEWWPWQEYEIRCPPGTTLDDHFGPPMLKILANDGMDNFFRCALVARASKCEPMCCIVCDECQIVSSSWGTASKKKRCMMTPRCAGVLERVRVFDLTMPKRRRRK